MTAVSSSGNNGHWFLIALNPSGLSARLQMIWIPGSKQEDGSGEKPPHNRIPHPQKTAPARPDRSL